jgi:predicted tellurium resistance membrane protein TerC
MIELLTSTEAWAALLTLTALEIVLGIDNVIFLSVIVYGIPPAGETGAADQASAGAGIPDPVAHILVWLIGLTNRLTVSGSPFSWRDIILIGGGLF